MLWSPSTHDGQLRLPAEVTARHGGDRWNCLPSWSSSRSPICPTNAALHSTDTAARQLKPKRRCDPNWPDSTRFSAASVCVNNRLGAIGQNRKSLNKADNFLVVSDRIVSICVHLNEQEHQVDKQRKDCSYSYQRVTGPNDFEAVNCRAEFVDAATPDWILTTMYWQTR